MAPKRDKLREQVDQRRQELKKALHSAERDGAPEDERGFLESDLHTVEETLRNGWQEARPAEVAGLKKWLGDTGPEVDGHEPPEK